MGAQHTSLLMFSQGLFFSPQQHPENLYKAVWLQRQSYSSIPCISWLQNTASLNLSGVCCSVCLHSAFGPVWSVGSAYQPSVFHPLYCWVPASAPLLRSCLGPEMKPTSSAYSWVSHCVRWFVGGHMTSRWQSRVLTADLLLGAR